MGEELVPLVWLVSSALILCGTRDTLVDSGIREFQTTEQLDRRRLPWCGREKSATATKLVGQKLEANVLSYPWMQFRRRNILGVK